MAFFDDFGGLLGGLTQAGGAYYAGEKGIEAAEKSGTDAFNLTQTLGQDVVEQSKFKPFALTSNIGNVNATRDAFGNLNTQLSLSDALQGGQDDTFSAMAGILGNVTGDQSAREGDVFAKLEAMMQPDRERERLGLEQRLFNQGRTGVSTSAFGGTPEQLAMQKAIEEQRAGSAVQAMNIANTERQQGFDSLTTLGNLAMLPQEQLNQQAKFASQIAGDENVAARQGATDMAALGRTGIQAKLGGDTNAANIRQTQMEALIAAIGGTPVNADGSGGSTGFLEQLVNGWQNRNNPTGPLNSGGTAPGTSGFIGPAQNTTQANTQAFIDSYLASIGG
tara:strand:- start:9917 stop:10921 length:1005 start_codon:yes stop_codon:yes gene_type:complete